RRRVGFRVGARPLRAGWEEGVMCTFLARAAEDPAGLLPAREQMAFSLGWHIVLACFGVAFPTMIYVVHRGGLTPHGPVPGLPPAREQMAFSLGWPIVLACFGFAFPTMIYVVHRRGLTRDDPVALGLA